MRVPLQEAAGLSLGLELVVSIVLMSALGHWVDGKLHSAPAGLLVGFVIGAAAGFRSLLRYAARMDRLAKTQEEAEARKKAEAAKTESPAPETPAAPQDEASKDQG